MGRNWGPRLECGFPTESLVIKPRTLPGVMELLPRDRASGTVRLPDMQAVATA